MQEIHISNKQYLKNLEKKRILDKINAKVNTVIQLFDAAESIDKQKNIVEYIRFLYEKNVNMIDVQQPPNVLDENIVSLLESFSNEKLHTLYVVLQRKIDLQHTLSEEDFPMADDETFQVASQNLPEK